jgi:type IV pilus assembly protein PilA
MQRNRAFTLIELLVVIAVIGILAAIAIPQFASYRQRAFDARAKSDLHNVALAEEAYFQDYERYVACDHTNCHTLLPAVRHLSSGVSLEIMVSSATATSFTGTAQHVKSPNLYSWNSADGGLQ